MKRRGSWFLSLVIVGIFAFFTLKSGGQVPLPSNAQTTAADSVRIPIKMEAIQKDARGEDWNLTTNQSKTYYANMYLNGQEKRIFASRKTIKTDASGTLYQTAGIIQFGQQKYHATQLFVDKDGKSGYIQFAKN